MNFERLILLVDAAVYRYHQKHLKDIDVLVLRESLQKKSYDQIADANNYTGQYLRQDVGPKLWHTLSAALNVKIAKKNCATVLETYWHHNKATQSSAHEQSQTLTDVSPHAQISTETSAKIDWGHTLSPAIFYGRQSELDQLQTWILKDRIRLLTLTGMGGMGKTALACTLIDRIQSDFDFVWVCSCRNAPQLNGILTQLFDFVGIDVVPQDFDAAIHQCLQLLQDHRCLLIFDNLETLLQEYGNVGSFISSHRHYAQFLDSIANHSHQSCVILTSRELPEDIGGRNGLTGPVRTIRLAGLQFNDAQCIMQEKGLRNLEPSSLEIVLSHYSGNPLALKIVAAGVLDLGQGDLRSVIPFIKQGILHFDQIEDLLERQFQRLDDVEQHVMYWLALHREPISLVQLNQDILRFNIVKQLPRAVQFLTRRSMIERNDSGLFLQPVVMEYVIQRFLNGLATELRQGQYMLLQTYSLLNAQAKDFIREAQEQFILHPLLKSLIAHFGSADHVRDHFLSLLQRLQVETPLQPSYACGNILNLLRLLDGNLNGLDCSKLSVWQAYLVGVPLDRINFSQSDLSRSVFSQVLSTTLSVCFSPDGQFFATAHADNHIRVWRTQDYKQQATYRGHKHWVSTVTFCPESQLLISGSFDKTIKLWDLETGLCLNTLEGHTAWIWSVVCSTDQQILASCSDDHTIRIWDRHTGDCLKILDQHQSAILSLALSPCGKYLASASSDITASVKIWDWQTGESRDLIPATLKRRIRSIAFSPDGQYLATGSLACETEVWDVATGHCVHQFKGHSQPVTSVAFSPELDGGTAVLASGSQDCSLKIWNLEFGQAIHTLRGHPNGICSVAFHPHRPLLISGGNDSTVKLWDIKTGDSICTLQGYSMGIKAIALSPDGQQLASGGGDLSIQVWDAQTYEHHQPLDGYSSWIRALTYTAGGTQLLSAGNDNKINRWSLKTGQLLQTYTGHRSLIFALKVNDETGVIASASDDHNVRLWDLQMGECMNTLVHEGRVWSVDFSPEGRWLACGQGETIINVWDLQSKTLSFQLEEHTSVVWDVTFSPDSKLLASASDDMTAKVWDMHSRACLQTLCGHTGSIWAIAFSPDGTRLVTGSNDHTIKVWSASSGELLQTLYGHESAILDVTFRGETEVISASQAGRIKIWDLTTESCLTTLRDRLPYEGMDLRDASGLTEAQKISLATLGASL